MAGDNDDNKEVKEPEKICKLRGRTNASHGGGNDGRRPRSNSLGPTNALVQDKKLKALLETADEIQSLDHFMYWKDEFLETFSKYLDSDKTATAREADDALYIRMQKLAKNCVDVKRLCAEGAIQAEGCNVSGQKAINEFVAEMAKTESVLKEYFPRTIDEEDKVGYTKFNLAAVLVRDGFRVYDIMTTTRDYIVALRDGPLGEGDILKPNHRSIMEFYLKEIDNFCDTMADLGMYKLMQKCVELYKVRPRKKKKQPFDRKTMDPLSDSDGPLADKNKGRMFRRSKRNFKSIMDKGWSSGVTGQHVHKPKTEDDEMEPGSAQSGTSNKKAPDKHEPDPDQPNDWIYYWDVATGTVGKVSRRDCMEKNFLIKKDKKGKEQQEAEIKDWHGEEGKLELIWKFKEALKQPPHDVNKKQ